MGGWGPRIVITPGGGGRIMWGGGGKLKKLLPISSGMGSAGIGRYFYESVRKILWKRRDDFYYKPLRQLRLYGHVARHPAEDPAHRILFCRDPRGWSMPRGRPHASWSRQVESVRQVKDTAMAGLAFAWAMARRRPKNYRRKMDAATGCFGPCSHSWPDLMNLTKASSEYDKLWTECKMTIANTRNHQYRKE